MLGFFCFFCEISQTYLLLKTTWAKAKNMWFGVCRIWIFTTLLEHLFWVCTHVYVCMLSHVWLCVTPLTVANQAPLSMVFPRQSGVCCHFLLQEIFPIQGFNLCLLCHLYWQVDSLPLCHLGRPVYSVFFIYILSNIHNQHLCQGLLSLLYSMKVDSQRS